MRTKRWNQNDLSKAAKESTSYKQVIYKLGLVPAGGNYQQIKDYLNKWNINIKHFRGWGWNVGMKFKPKPPMPLSRILRKKVHTKVINLRRDCCLKA
ncbi:MAG: hypothetical protein COT26_00735 [Candidatus Kerfeldbacteria bacterium CG08_land_8_20_14_0_20_43_14]|uniref:Uncharacterized protein n=1 Tax=Candidatus Kerfeldbacteria bacterium CG08_land_8_20_14_0_20_43_14 TaxID=2014246 RepID=A0A2H0YR06_9BACT|nr:MAG: hypothetical protein COT26_00735 [Candidatus Kerfeldbacteria bacterium CG08_land_8_20_14_0_20_43_14]